MLGEGHVELVVMIGAREHRVVIVVTVHNRGVQLGFDQSGFLDGRRTHWRRTVGDRAEGNASGRWRWRVSAGGLIELRPREIGRDPREDGNAEGNEWGVSSVQRRPVEPLLLEIFHFEMELLLHGRIPVVLD